MKTVITRWTDRAVARFVPQAEASAASCTRINTCCCSCQEWRETWRCSSGGTSWLVHKNYGCGSCR